MPLTTPQRKWIEALRSGAYKQGRRTLKRETIKGIEYCCLGVLCELAVQEGVISSYIGNYLPYPVMVWAGMKTQEALFTHKNGFTLSLADDANDGRGNPYISKTFSEIADLIESEPEGLFVQSTDTPVSEDTPISTE